MTAKIYLYIIIPVILFYVVSFTVLSFHSSIPPEDIGLKDGVLRPCPGTPNCVLSEAKGRPEYIEPIAFEGDAPSAWAVMREAVLALHGNIEKEGANYLWVTFKSRFWHFIDDMELRLDEKNKVIHIRSASRVGKGDLGVNRKRAEKLRALFKIMMKLT